MKKQYLLVWCSKEGELSQALTKDVVYATSLFLTSVRTDNPCVVYLGGAIIASHSLNGVVNHRPLNWK